MGSSLRRCGHSFVEIFDKIDVQIGFNEMLRNLGYHAHDSPPPAVSKLIHQEIEEGYSLIYPVAAYNEMAAYLTEAGKVALRESLILNIPHADKEWRGLERVGLAISTIGPRLEERIRQLFTQGDGTMAVILDSVGTVALRNINNNIDSLVCQRARERGMIAGPRFEPGSIDWELNDQTVFFSLLPAQELGVRLNKQCQMSPLKSSSFAIGMGCEMPIPRGRRPCWYCNRLECPARDPSAVG